jgi:maleylpyruvate isomerase
MSVKSLMPTPTFAAFPTDLLPRVAESTDRILATVDLLTEEELRAPSGLPDWSRAHVLAHLSRGADSRVRLLTAARTGRPIRQYPDEQTRTREIEQSARRSRSELVADFRHSADRLHAAIVEHPAESWGRPVCWLGEEERSVDDVVPSRLQELEIHHVDLAAGYGSAEWPAWFVRAELPGVVADLRGRPQTTDLVLAVAGEGTRYPLGPRPTRTVRGPGGALLAWLIGRGDGTGLTLDPPGPLPEPSAWK